MELKEVEVDVLTNDKALAALDENQLDDQSKSGISKAFASMFQKAEELKVEAAEIKVTSPEQVEEIKKARALRLKVKNLRVASDKTRKDLKAESLRKGKAIDALANVFKYLVVPIEDELKAQEDIAKRIAAERKEKLKDERLAQLEPLEGVIGQADNYPVAEMSESAWEIFLSGAMARQRELEDRRQAEKEAEEKRLREEEEARLAREAARQKKAEEDKIALEAALKEAEEEREASRKQREKEREEREKQEAIRKKAEAKALKEKRALEAKLKKEREEQEAARKKAEAKALKEKRALEAKLKKEKELARAKAEAERKAAAEKEAEALRKSQAPDKDKFREFGVTLRDLDEGLNASSKAGKRIAQELSDRLDALAAWLEDAADKL